MPDVAVVQFNSGMNKKSFSSLPLLFCENHFVTNHRIIFFLVCHCLGLLYLFHMKLTGMFLWVNKLLFNTCGVAALCSNRKAAPSSSAWHMHFKPRETVLHPGSDERWWSALSPLSAWSLHREGGSILCCRGHAGTGTHAQSLCCLQGPQGRPALCGVAVISEALTRGRNSSVSSVLGSLSCVMQRCGFNPPLSLR